MRTRPHYYLLPLAWVMASLLLLGCGDDSGSSSTPDTQQSDTPTDTSTADTADPDASTECQVDADCTTTAACMAAVCVDGACREEAAADGTSCDNGEDCTEGVCSAGSCTSGAVTAGWCKVDGACYADGAPNPANPCEECVAATASEAWSADDTNACDDGLACTTDSCVAGSCTGTPDNTLCNDDNLCTADICDGSTGLCTYTPAQAGQSCDDAGGFCWTGGRCVSVNMLGERGGDTLNALAPSPDGSRIAVATDQGIDVWSIPQLSRQAVALGPWTHVVWSPDQSYLAASDLSKPVQGNPAYGELGLVNPDTPNDITPLATCAGCLPTQFLADGRFLSVVYHFPDAMAYTGVVDMNTGTKTNFFHDYAASPYHRSTSASGAGDMLAVWWHRGQGTGSAPTWVVDSFDFSVVQELNTEGRAEFTASGSTVVYFNESGGHFEAFDLMTSTVTTIAPIIEQGQVFVPGHFDVFPDGDTIIAYNSVAVGETAHVWLVRLSDGFAKEIDEFVVQTAAVNASRQIVAPDGEYSFLPVSSSPTAAFRVYEHTGLWEPWGCTLATDCADGEFCNFSTHTCHVSQCHDGQDNDGDNLIDPADPDCALGVLELVAN